MSTTLIEQIAAAHTRAAQRTQDGPTGDDERWTIVLERDYDATPEEVWACWTEPDRLGRWLGRIDRQPEVGGTVRMEMAPDGEAAHDVTLLDCEPPTSLTVRWGGFGEGESEVRLGLTEVEDGTRLRLEHSGLRARGAWSYGAGWGEVLHLADRALHDPGFDVAVVEDETRGSLEEGLQHYWDELVPTGRGG
ncbi:SRPBCC domain-containing protein [Ornithinimicrobium panacihumi]|uniref:SRPBCC domain-containing protein n=1 Tax=Ornithinimicrobium panacihumi TaxID=2008449 RepID=UPI003F8CDEFC